MTDREFDARRLTFEVLALQRSRARLWMAIVALAVCTVALALFAGVPGAISDEVRAREALAPHESKLTADERARALRGAREAIRQSHAAEASGDLATFERERVLDDARPR